jgi:hypothetical protein
MQRLQGVCRAQSEVTSTGKATSFDQLIGRAYVRPMNRHSGRLTMIATIVQAA